MGTDSEKKIRYKECAGMSVEEEYEFVRDIIAFSINPIYKV